MPASGWPVSKNQPSGREASRRPAHGPGRAAAAELPTDTTAVAAPEEWVLQPLAQVAQRNDLLPLAERLLQLRAWLASDLAGLEDELISRDHGSVPGMQGEQTGTGQAAEHLLQLAGKRIRPLCVILAARMGGRSMDAQVRATAAACELVHAATLLHDDVVDDSHERRGAPAARTLFGNSASILAGDHLLVHALRLVERAERPALLSSLLEVMARMVRAEALQLERRGRFEPSRTTYLEVIRGKTAALFAWGLAAGGVLGGCDDATRSALEQVGHHLGMAFQLVDDVLDLEGDSATTGKDALQDLREGKLTWPLILAAEQVPALAEQLAAAAASRAQVNVSPEQKAAQAKLQAEVVRQIRATGALQATRRFANEQAAAACACLENLPAGRAREALGWVVESAVQRLR